MHPLDNVIWTALSTHQAHFAEANELARRFPVEIGPLAGLKEPTEQAFNALADLLNPEESAALFLDKAQEPPSGLTVIATAPLLQMVQEKPIDSPETPFSPFELIELGVEDIPEMIELTQLTKPGPFGTRTRELGMYLGIRQSGKLVAMSGERLHVHGYTEVSAVCTHPDHTGHGYAAALMQAVMNSIRARGETPFLHTRAYNDRAISLYERLGFSRRALLHLSVVRKA
ncbi:MAG TPA: GNAT family N-acetyltransferase [Terriglobales bacterium]|nr:GNAT family N-acetyltransferase [Terriglobales bacterium]